MRPAQRRALHAVVHLAVQQADACEEEHVKEFLTEREPLRQACAASPPILALNATPTPHLRLLAFIAISPAHRVPWALLTPFS